MLCILAFLSMTTGSVTKVVMMMAILNFGCAKRENMMYDHDISLATVGSMGTISKVQLTSEEEGTQEDSFPDITDQITDCKSRESNQAVHIPARMQNLNNSPVLVQVTNAIIDASLIISVVIWFVQSCQTINDEASVSGMAVFICLSFSTALLARGKISLSAYFTNAFPFMSMLKRIIHWCHGGNLHHYAYNGIKEQLVICVLIRVLSDRSWVIDTAWDHPYDPVVPITHNHNTLRLWQQCCFAILWLYLLTALLQSATPLGSAKFVFCKRPGISVASLTGVLVTLTLLYLSDLMLMCVTVWASFFGLMTLLLKDLDNDFPALRVLCFMLGCTYMFSGLNKCNKECLDTPLRFVNQGMKEVPGFLPWLDHNPSVKLAIGAMVVIFQVSCGLLLLSGRPRCMKMAAAMMCMMHAVIVCNWCFFDQKFAGGGMMPVQYAFPTILMTLFMTEELVASTPMATTHEVESVKSAPMPSTHEVEKDHDGGGSCEYLNGAEQIQVSNPSPQYFLNKNCFWVLYMIVLSVFFIVGPTLYFIPNYPMWPGNGLMSFAFWGNRAKYYIKVSCAMNPNHITAGSQQGLWHFVDKDRNFKYGDFYRMLYERRFSLAGPFSLAGSAMPEARCESERSQLQTAEWVSRQLGVDTTLTIRSKARFGYVAPNYTYYWYKCTPVCTLSQSMTKETKYF